MSFNDLLEGFGSLVLSSDAEHQAALAAEWEGDGLTLEGSPRLRWERELDLLAAEIQAQMVADPARQAARVAQGLPADVMTLAEVAYSWDRARLRAPDPPLSQAGRFAHGEHQEPAYHLPTPSLMPPRRRRTA